MSRIRVEDGEVVLRRSRRWPRATVAVPFASALILVVGWSVLWGVARWQAGLAIDRVIAAEAAHGRTWTCPGRSITGFPFRIAIACPSVTFSGVVDREPAEGRLGGLRVEAFVYEPSAIDVALDGPLTLTSQGGRDDIALDWSSFRATLRGLTGDLKRIEVALDDATMTRRDTGPIRADHVELHAGPAPGHPAEEAADIVDLALTGAAVPALDALTGEASVVSGHVAGVVTRAFGNLPDLGPGTVERWRAAGGIVDIAALDIAKGPLAATATGRIGLDPEHRLAGRLDASVKGFEPLAKRFGIPIGAVQVGGLLSSLIGKAGGRAPGAPGPGGIALPITFADGAVSIGPVRLAEALKPLY